MKAIIIGGGIGGLASAVALRRVGIETDVFEQADQLREVGSGLTIWTDGLRALEVLGVGQGVMAASSIVRRFEQRDWRGNLLAVIPWAKVEKKQGAAAALCIHRRDLLLLLTSEVDSNRIHCGYRCIAVEDSATGATARFSNGQEAHGDVLVAADGLHSVVRTILHGESKPRYAGYTCWRGVANFDSKARAAVVPFEAWGPGKRFAMIPCGAGRIFWYATKNAPEGGEDAPGGRKAEVLECFRDWFSPIPEVITATEGEILRNDIVDRIPTTKWGRRRITLLGDAAHPTTPNLGHGASMAIQDAVVLADCLHQAGEAEAGLRIYERKRQPKTASIVNHSWRMGVVGQLENRWACAVRNAITRSIPSSVSLKILESIMKEEVPNLVVRGPGTVPIG